MIPETDPLPTPRYCEIHSSGWMEFEKAFTVLQESTNWDSCKVMQYMGIKMGKRP